MIGQNHTCHIQSGRHIYLEGVTFDPIGDGTDYGQPDPCVVCTGGKYDGRSPSSLFVTQLRVEIDDDRVAALGCSAGWIHRISRPTAGPVSVSPCRLSSVTLANRSSNVNLGLRVGQTTIAFPNSETSTLESGPKPSSEAKTEGIRTVRSWPSLLVCTSWSIC